MKLTKCLIANRGEIAVRITRLPRTGHPRGRRLSDADARARHVLLADEAYPIGAANPPESYLNIEQADRRRRGRRAATACIPATASCPKSEAFAQAVIDAGLIWVGPPPDAIRRMGVKTEARALMEAAGVPLVPGYQGDGDDARFLDAAERIGYPVMVKAAGGGGGKGIRVVERAADLPEALRAARREAQHAFGDARVFLERYHRARAPRRNSGARRPARAYGSPVRARMQRPAPPPEGDRGIAVAAARRRDTRARMGAAGVAAAQAVGYVNAGTVEFIVTPDGEFYFLEMNTRLQVEHPVTEMVTGLDLVKLQFAIAAGEPLPFTQDDLTPARARHRVPRVRRRPAQRLSPGGRRGAALSRRRRASACASIAGVQSGDTITDPLRPADRQDHRLRPHARRARSGGWTRRCARR